MGGPFNGQQHKSQLQRTSPVLLLPPMVFMATASVVCASSEMEPYDMAPVQNRFTISAAGSTCAEPERCSTHSICHAANP